MNRKNYVLGVVVTSRSGCKHVTWAEASLWTDILSGDDFRLVHV